MGPNMPQGLRYRRATEESASEGATPTKLARRLVSALLIIHFCSIFLAVTSYSSPSFPAPQLAVRASQPLQPYLQGTFLNNGYRFFAPNPGTPSVLWFRVQYEDRSVRWVELPGPPSSLLRAPHQRRLNLAIQVGQNLAPAPAEDGKRTLAPLGVRLVESWARHVAKA